MVYIQTGPKVNLPFDTIYNQIDEEIANFVSAFPLCKVGREDQCKSFTKTHELKANKISQSCHINFIENGSEIPCLSGKKSNNIPTTLLQLFYNPFHINQCTHATSLKKFNFTKLPFISYRLVRKL